jgi:predicted transcriptional regulator of viral defense system
MTNYEEIYEHAADNYGLITSAEAKDMGIPAIELVKLAHRGRLVRVGQGVYRIHHYIPNPLDRYAEAIAIVGKDAFIYGESVLAMHGLALVNPRKITIATRERVRKKLPAYIEALKINTTEPVVRHEGIPSQSVSGAIRTCHGMVMTERLLDAVTDARNRGLVNDQEAKELARELKR